MRPGCLLFFQIVFLLSGFRVLAQRNIPANELESAYGIFPAMEIKKIAGDFYRNGTDPKAVEKITGTGSAVISYNRAVKERFYWGASVFYDKATISYNNMPELRDWYVFGLLLNAKYNYVFDARFHMYSGLSAGYAGSWTKKAGIKDHHDAIAFQARVIGLRFGARVGVFAELGFGYEGILKAGVSIHF
jgi:hypothetical protein